MTHLVTILKFWRNLPSLYYTSSSVSLSVLCLSIIAPLFSSGGDFEWNYLTKCFRYFYKYVDVINSFKQKKPYHAYHRSLDVNCFADICCRGPSDCVTFDSLLEKIDQTRFVQIERWTCLPHRWFMKTMEVIIVSLSHGILISCQNLSWIWKHMWLLRQKNHVETLIHVRETNLNGLCPFKIFGDKNTVPKMYL